MEYAESIYKKLIDNSIRAELEYRNEGIGKKIRTAEVTKIPYIIIVGDEEEKEKNISFRIHKKGDQGKRSLEEFMDSIKKIIISKGSHYEI
jgi:threonyl-tRNA synthetase